MAPLSFALSERPRSGRVLDFPPPPLLLPVFALLWLRSALLLFLATRTVGAHVLPERNVKVRLPLENACSLSLSSRLNPTLLPSASTCSRESFVLTYDMRTN